MIRNLPQLQADRFSIPRLARAFAVPSDQCGENESDGQGSEVSTGLRFVQLRELSQIVGWRRPHRGLAIPGWLCYGIEACPPFRRVIRSRSSAG
jgi:hypothetical protein